MQWEEKWQKKNRANIARYTAEKAIDYLPLTINTSDKEPKCIIEAIYNELIKKNIKYIPEHFDPSEAEQIILTPKDILVSQRESNCLDLAVCFCGLCFGYGLLPMLIVIDGHALAAVSVMHKTEMWDDRQGWPLLDTAPVTDVTKLRNLIDNGGYVVIECTGFARSEKLATDLHHYPENVGRTSGVLSFERACEAGREQLNLDRRPLLFALDIAAARFSWKIPSYSFDNQYQLSHVSLPNYRDMNSSFLQLLNPVFIQNETITCTNEDCMVVKDQPCIFLCHNVVGDEKAEDALNRLSCEIEKAGFIVLFDKQRPPFSEEWRRQVYLCIQQCHGAIVFFSEGALLSNWVEYEVRMLNARKYLNPKFAMIPLLLPPVLQEQLAKYRFSADVLDKLQTLTEETVPESVITPFVSSKNMLGENPLQKLGARIASGLNKLDWATIERIAWELNANMNGWPIDIEKRTILLAQELLKVKLPDVIYNVMIELAPKLEKTYALKLVDLLVTSWIDERAVAPIPQIVSEPPIRSGIYLNSVNHRTAQMYIHRASNTWPKPIQALNTSGENPFEALEQQIMEGYKKTRGIEDEDEDISNIHIKNLLRSPGTITAPCIVLIPGYLDRKVLKKLRETYKGVTFFLLSGDEPADALELARNNIELLLPLLDSRQEGEAHRLYYETRNIVRENCPY